MISYTSWNPWWENANHFGYKTLVQSATCIFLDIFDKELSQPKILIYWWGSKNGFILSGLPLSCTTFY
jgi:hypothetical protein